jgi:hypothetical protein
MALTKTITIKNNFGEDSKFANAYLRVDRIEATRHLVSVQLGFYKEGGKDFLSSTTLSFVPDLDGENFIKQAYKHLKSLPEFADAVDC